MVAGKGRSHLTIQVIPFEVSNYDGVLQGNMRKSKANTYPLALMGRNLFPHHQPGMDDHQSTNPLDFQNYRDGHSCFDFNPKVKPEIGEMKGRRVKHREEGEPYENCATRGERDELLKPNCS